MWKLLGKKENYFFCLNFLIFQRTNNVVSASCFKFFCVCVRVKSAVAS